MFNFLKHKEQNKFVKHFKATQLEKMKNQPFGITGSVILDGKPFEFHDARSFYVTYDEIMKQKIYKFSTTSKSPLIIDCGANMGVSVYFFSNTYPTARIIAFEPEEDIYPILERNVETFLLENVTLHKKAVWDSATTLEFFTDKGMGGSVTNVYRDQKPTLVETVVMADFLHEKVDFLKLDIEGAEYRVLKSCGNLLRNVENLFVEYHSFINQEQHLEDLLLLLKENGFRYHLRQSFSRENPFTDTLLACENMDMAINIFAYRNQ